MACNGYGRACGSRFNGYPCTSGAPQFDANGNIIPQRTVLCGNGVCTQTANFSSTAVVGNDALLSPGVFQVNGNANVTGELTISPISGGNGGGLALTYGSSTLVQANFYLDQLSDSGPGASLVYRISQNTTAEPNAQGGHLGVIFDSAAGAATATGFRYTSQPPSFYIGGGPGIYYEEKNYAAFLGIIPAAAGEGMLTTTVLPSGLNIFQQFVGDTGIYLRSSSGSTTTWNSWQSIDTTTV